MPRKKKSSVPSKRKAERVAKKALRKNKITPRIVKKDIKKMKKDK